MRPIREEDFCLAGQEGPLWASVCYFLAASQWKKIIDAFPSADMRGEFAGLISALLSAVVDRFSGDMAAMNTPVESVEGKTLFDVVLMCLIQALLLKRDAQLIDIIQSLCQVSEAKSGCDSRKLFGKFLASICDSRFLKAFQILNRESRSC